MPSSQPATYSCHWTAHGARAFGFAPHKHLHNSLPCMPRDEPQLERARVLAVSRGVSMPRCVQHTDLLSELCYNIHGGVPHRHSLCVSMWINQIDRFGGASVQLFLNANDNDDDHKTWRGTHTKKNRSHLTFVTVRLLTPNASMLRNIAR